MHGRVVVGRVGRGSGLATITVALILVLGGRWLAGSPPPQRAATTPTRTGAEEIQVPAPPLTEGIFPCSSCHDGKSMKPNPRRRILSMHDEIELQHGLNSRWCLDCHSLEDRDRLHLANGEVVEFSASYQLCGQCHGDKLRDWRAGIHGKRTGAWNGKKQYLLCVHCHNPHTPRFQPLKPMPPPQRPGDVRLKKGGVR